MEAPEIRYTRTHDGLRIAYAVFAGSGRPILNIPPPNAPPLSVLPRVKSLAESLDALFRGRKSVRFDFRGAGFSDLLGDELTLDHQVADIEAVTSAIGEEMDVFASYTACFPAIAYAARHPSQWRSLTLIAPGLNGRNYVKLPLWEARHTIRDTTDAIGWYEMVLRTSYDVPGADSWDLARRFNETLPIRNVNRHFEAIAASDVGPLLSQVELPTLVVGHQLSHLQSAAVAERLPRCTLVSTDPFVFNAETGVWLRGLIDEFSARIDGRRIAGQVRRDQPATGLTTRECQILACVSAGDTNEAIADRLTVSTRTVERHVANIYTKLNVHNRVEAANWAREHGVL